MTTTLVHYEEAGGIATITMDDGKANAIGHAMIDALNDALARAESSKAIVLTGREGKFSGGFDLKVMMSGMGHAVAAGALILLAADTRIGVEGPFKIGLNETAIGMTLPILAQELARDRLDPRRLTEATVQAHLYDPADARDAGYLDRIVAPEALAAAARETATALAKLAAPAYAATKARLRRATIEHVRRTLDADLAELTAPK
jgi:enoyl-CoA hydratase